MGIFLTELTRQVALRRINLLLENEDDVQDALSAALDNLQSDSPASDLDEDDEAELDDKKSTDADSKDVEVEEISPQTIIEKLNTIRSGHSLKRSDIRDQMEEYIDALDDAEKVALNAFLEGIAAIITGAQDSDDAEEPRPEVTMKTKTKVVDKIRPKKRVVVNADDAEEVTVKRTKKAKPHASTEDTAPPIKVS